MIRTRLLRAASGALALALLPALALAHPLGNFTVNHYAGIRVAADHADLDIVIDYAEIPTVSETRRLDTNHDGRTSAHELDAARAASCARLAPGLMITLDGARLTLATQAAGLQLLPGAAGLRTLRLICEYRARYLAALKDGSVLVFADQSDVDRIGWREIVVGGDGVRLGPSSPTADPLADRAQLAAGGVSERLTRYPTDLLSRPLDERSVAMVATHGGPALPRFTPPDATPLGTAVSASGAAAAGTAGAVPGGVGGDLTGLVNLRNLTLPVILLSLLGAAVLGGGHALTPGHGKTVMAAYLIGSHGTMRQAVVLGVSVTASHTIGVIGLAVVVQVAADVVAPERIYPILGAISGVMVVAIGTWLLLGCVRRWRERSGDASAHDHPHEHDHDHPRAHRNLHEHPHAATRLPGLAGVISLGIAGGLVPSTSALVLLLAALAGGHAAYGLALAVAFGIGMAVVLSGIGIALSRGQALAARLPTVPGASRLASGLPWLTATAVFIGGILLTSQALLTRL